ncbi:hypothetical protein [Pseudaminobacter soli (ex Li et al. 2025)]|uniref:Uncharacterized protein n=1 Tax=Pseudaminobacter soli (ex Li et al. 2025) TaxID=1295366 RepID=A0A2P7RSE8_9HYPH|nr:hypothetical protein [Mesorhizobium soli]PSJ53132.1 hypothetical protein C7I85_28455 [Mesorhizobium soli]
MVLAILAGIGAYIAVNALFGGIHGFACGSSQAMNTLLRFSVFALPIRMACWCVAAWAGWSAFVAMGGW